VTPRLDPAITALGGAVAISFSAILFRLADTTPVTGAFFRLALAVPVLGVLRLATRGEDRRTGRDRLIAGVAGLFLAADLVAWHGSIDQIGAGLGTMIANSQVVIVPFATWAIFRERPSRRAMLAMPVVMVGLALITGMGRTDAFGDRPVLGVLLGVAAACFYSGFLIGYRRSNRVLAPSSGPLFDASVGASVGALLVSPLVGGVDLAPGWEAFGWLAVLALTTQVAGWLAIGYALPRLPAAHTSFAILLQPSLTLVWGALIFGERASWVQATGVGMVLAGILMVTLRRDIRRA
jgi:drug/metabolite transporter (DMT)-like permease